MLSRSSNGKYTLKEELANVLTHGLGVLLTLVGTPIILIPAWKSQDFWQFTGIIVYCLTMLNTYISSSLYHWAKKPHQKLKLRIYDHISIYFLIGGTYTPFILIFYHETTGLWFLFLHWLIILVGVIYKLFFTGRYEWISVASYLFLGWMVIFIFEPVTRDMSVHSFYFLIGGGLSYTLGIVFYLLHRLPYHHAIWHIFVLGGSIGHYLSLWFAVKA